MRYWDMEKKNPSSLYLSTIPLPSLPHITAIDFFLPRFQRPRFFLTDASSSLLLITNSLRPGVNLSDGVGNTQVFVGTFW